MAGTSSKQIIERDGDGRYWLMADLLQLHHEYVVFTRPDGSKRLDLVQTFDVFEWKDVTYEVQGFDRPNRRWWVEPIEMALDVPTTTEGGRAWRRRVA